MPLGRAVISLVLLDKCLMRFDVFFLAVMRFPAVISCFLLRIVFYFLCLQSHQVEYVGGWGRLSVHDGLLEFAWLSVQVGRFVGGEVNVSFVVVVGAHASCVGTYV